MPTTIVLPKAGPQDLEIIVAAICAAACVVSVALAGVSPEFAAAVALLAAG